jgi:integrase
LAETDVSICNRNRIMTGLRFLFRVTLRRLDLAEEVYHIREPQRLPLVMSVDEIKRLLAVASSLKTRVLLSLGYGCGLRASEIVRLKVKHIDRAQNIIRIEQSKGRKDRNVMLSDEMLGLLRQWCPVLLGAVRIRAVVPGRAGQARAAYHRACLAYILPHCRNHHESGTYWRVRCHCIYGGHIRHRQLAIFGQACLWVLFYVSIFCVRGSRDDCTSRRIQSHQADALY